jgi:hypothetical protein
LIGNWSIFGEIGRLSSIEEPFKTWPLRGFSYPLRGCHCFWFYLVAVVAVTLTIQMYRLQSISIPCALVLRIKRISTFPQTRLSELWILHGPWLSVIITPCFQYVIAAMEHPICFSLIVKTSSECLEICIANCTCFIHSALKHRVHILINRVF